MWKIEIPLRKKSRKSLAIRRDMLPVTVTVDQKWVNELIKRLDKYEMFKDRSQKVWEYVQSTAQPEQNPEGNEQVVKKIVKKKSAETKSLVKTKKDDKPAKAKKDDGKPKRAISAYLYYASERRPNLKKEDPSLGFGELTRQIADEWKTMKEKDKRKYNDLARADKKRYEEEQEQWLLSKPDQ